MCKSLVVIYPFSHVLLISSVFPQGNILMSSDDVPKPLLTDFGIAHVLNPGTVTLQLITDSENARGTTQYMAKEMISGDSSRENFYTKPADVWAFGMTVYVRRLL